LGLRFTADGTGLAVADSWNDRVSVFSTSADESRVWFVATGVSSPSDVEECEGGWLVACTASNTVEYVRRGIGETRDGGESDDRDVILGRPGRGDGEFLSPSALALAHGLGLIVREYFNEGRLQFFGTSDAIAMATMSTARLGWLVAVARCAARLTKPHGPVDVW
jgi:hypothetical protein